MSLIAGGIFLVGCNCDTARWLLAIAIAVVLALSFFSLLLGEG